MILNKNNKNEQAEYHDIFIPFKDNIFSKQGSHISLLFGTWILVLLPHAGAEPEIQGKFRGTRTLRLAFRQKHTKKGPTEKNLEFFLLDTVKSTFRMKNSTQIWTLFSKIRAFFPKLGHFFQFSKKAGKVSPLSSQVVWLPCLDEANVSTVNSDLANLSTFNWV